MLVQVVCVIIFMFILIVCVINGKDIYVESHIECSENVNIALKLKM